MIPLGCFLFHWLTLLASWMMNSSIKQLQMLVNRVPFLLHRLKIETTIFHITAQSANSLHGGLVLWLPIFLSCRDNLLARGKKSSLFFPSS